jgi:hypothetical protein
VLPHAPLDVGGDAGIEGIVRAENDIDVPVQSGTPVFVPLVPNTISVSHRQYFSLPSPFSPFSPFSQQPVLTRVAPAAIATHSANSCTRPKKLQQHFLKHYLAPKLRLGNAMQSKLQLCNCSEAELRGPLRSQAGAWERG